MNQLTIAAIHKKSLDKCNETHGNGVHKEQTEIGLVEAYSVSIHKPRGGITYRTTWMLNGKRISYSKLVDLAQSNV